MMITLLAAVYWLIPDILLPMHFFKQASRFLGTEAAIILGEGPEGRGRPHTR
jgi:hypothetical protein